MKALNIWVFRCVACLCGFIFASANAETISLKTSKNFNWLEKEHGSYSKSHTFVTAEETPKELAALLKKGYQLKLTVNDSTHNLVVSTGAIDSVRTMELTKVTVDRFRHIIFVRARLVLEPPPGGITLEKIEQEQKKQEEKEKVAKKESNTKKSKSKEGELPTLAELVRRAAKEIEEEKRRKNKSSEKVDKQLKGDRIVVAQKKDQKKKAGSSEERPAESAPVRKGVHNPGVMVSLGKLEEGKWKLQIQVTSIKGKVWKKHPLRSGLFSIKNYNSKRGEKRPPQNDVNTTPGLGPLIDPNVPSAIP